MDLYHQSLSHRPRIRPDPESAGQSYGQISFSEAIRLPETPQGRVAGDVEDRELEPSARPGGAFCDHENAREERRCFDAPPQPGV